MTNRSEDKGMQAKNTLCKNTDYAKQKKQIQNNESPLEVGQIMFVCFVCFTHSVPQG